MNQMKKMIRQIKEGKGSLIAVKQEYESEDEKE